MAGLFIDHVFDRAKGIHMYHVGFSPCQEYQEFYDWHNTKKLHYERTDMPNDYFVYLNEEDRIELYYRFGEHIVGTIEDDIDLSGFRNFLNPDPFDPLAEMLAEAIRDEINKEILSKINTSGTG